MENLDPPPPPPLHPKSRVEKWRGFALRAASSLIWGGDGGLLFHFILSKIVAALHLHNNLLITDYGLRSLSCSVSRSQHI